jgi:hypothetical protein
VEVKIFANKRDGRVYMCHNCQFVISWNEYSIKFLAVLVSGSYNMFIAGSGQSDIIF